MELKWSLFTREIRPHPQLRVRLQQKINKLEQNLAKHSPGAAQLKVSLEKHEKRKWFRAALALQMPSGSLRAEKFANDHMVAFDQAMRSLLRELVKSVPAMSPESSSAADIPMRPAPRPNFEATSPPASL